MKLSKFILIICCCIFLPIYASAVNGCKLPDGRVFTPQTGVALLGGSAPFYIGAVIVPFYNSAEISTTPTCPGWASSISLTGSKCATTSILTVVGLGVIASNEGVEVSFTYTLCPLDNYVGLFALITAGTGAYYIARKKMCVTA